MYDNIELDYDLSDFPNFVDANIISADYNGLKLTETELNNLNENRDFVHDCVMDSIF